MNARERMLMLILVAILGGFASIYGVWRWFVTPLRDYNATIAQLEIENNDIDKLVDDFNRERKKLTLAKLKSLPAKQELAAAEYMAYLKPLLERSGLTVEELSHGLAQKIKPVVAIPNVKEVGHQLMTFTVHMHGELGQLVKAMEQMQQTPYEHRIKTLIIDRAEMAVKKDASSKLSIQMTVETLLVAKTESKPGLPPGISPNFLIAAQFSQAPINWGLVAAAVQLKQTTPVAPADRDYDDIAKRNIFVGALPYAPTKKKGPTEIVKKEDPKPPEPEAPEEFTPAYVYLVQTDPVAQTAYLHNRLYRTANEMKLVAKEQSGYDTFRVTDEDGAYVFFRAKVLKVELRQIYFQIKDQVFTIQIGQNLAQAKSYSSTRTFVEMEDEGLYDRAFAKKELDKEKTDNKGKPMQR